MTPFRVMNEIWKGMLNKFNITFNLTVVKVLTSLPILELFRIMRCAYSLYKAAQDEKMRENIVLYERYSTLDVIGYYHILHPKLREFSLPKFSITISLMNDDARTEWKIKINLYARA